MQTVRFANRAIFLRRINRSYSPGRGNTREIEMAAENRGMAGRGVECNFCRDTKIFDAISAVRLALFEVTEPSCLFCGIKSSNVTSRAGASS